MEPFKRSTARDFRINAQTVENILDEDNISSEGSEEEGGEEGEEPPKAKRLKRT